MLEKLDSGTTKRNYLVIGFITLMLLFFVNVAFVFVDDPLIEQLSDLDEKWKDPYDFAYTVRTDEWVRIAKGLDDYSGLSDQDLFLIQYRERGDLFPYPGLEYIWNLANNKFYESTLTIAAAQELSPVQPFIHSGSEQAIWVSSEFLLPAYRIFGSGEYLPEEELQWSHYKNCPGVRKIYLGG